MESLPRTVLLAEHMADEVELIRGVVAPFAPRIRLEVVRSGREALQVLGGELADLDRPAYSLPGMTFLESDLPDISGCEVLRWIRQHPRLRGMIVVLLVGPEAEDQVQCAYQLKVNSVLLKHPLFDMPEVCHSILRYWFDYNQPPILG